MNRRSFIAIFVFFIFFLLCIPLHRVRAVFNRLKQQSFPDDDSLKTLVQVSECLFPKDQHPGAQALDIETFLAIQCKTAYFRNRMPALRRIIDYVNNESLLLGQKSFTASSGDIRNQIIGRVFSNSVNQQYPQILDDFYTMIDITIEGCFSDPMHGGNKQKLAWNMLNGSIKEEWFYA